MTTKDSPIAQAKKRGFLNDLFVIESTEENPLASASPSGSTASYEGEDLSPESERLLSAVPEVIGDAGQQDEGAQEGGVRITEAVQADLVPASSFIDHESVRDVLMLATGKLADVRKFEGWRITESQADKLAKPYAMVLGSLWERYAPVFLAQLSANTPGLMQAAMMTAIVFGPVIKADLSRKKPAAEMTRESTAVGTRSAPAQTRPPASAGGMIWAQPEEA